MSSGITTSLFVERPIDPPGHVIKNSLPINELHALDSVIIIRMHGGQPTTSTTIKYKYKIKIRLIHYVLKSAINL